MKKFIINSVVCIAAMAALSWTAQLASAQFKVQGPGGGGEAGNRPHTKRGQLNRHDRHLSRDHSYFDTWTKYLQRGRTYRLEVTSRHFGPYLWVQHRGHIHTNKALRSAQPRPVYVPLGPGGGGEVSTKRTILTFTPHRSGHYTFVINSMRGHRTGSYTAVLR